MLNVVSLASRERLRFVSNARAIHVRGFIDDAAPDPVLLRRQICDLSDLDACVLHWLTLRGFRIDPEVAHVLRLMVNQGDGGAHLIELADTHAAIVLHWRRKFRAMRLGALRRWHHVLRMLNIGLLIQSLPEAHLPALALQAKFADYTSLSRACADALGARPREIRTWIGWQPLLAPALRRAGIVSQ